jgi:AcrR family transcriptional regulator
VLRRDELGEAACDYVLEHGVIGLSLRPLAAAIGTSDRMLIYHFGSREALIADVLERCTSRSVAAVRELAAGPDVATAVRTLWEGHQAGVLDRCQRVYAQAAAEGLLGQDAMADPVRRSNAAWLLAVAEYLTTSGAAPERAERCARFVDAALMGLHLDLNVQRNDDVAPIVEDVARASASLAAG